jgi:hypothetical protein
MIARPAERVYVLLTSGLFSKRFDSSLSIDPATKWFAYSKRPFGGPEQVLAYLSRYTHRVAISNRRLVAADDGAIAFRWKDYRVSGPGRWKTMRLHPHEFVRRFLMHALPKGFHRIATTGSLPMPTAPRTSREPAHSSTWLRLPPPSRAAGYRHGHAPCAALPLCALWRPHDRD